MLFRPCRFVRFACLLLTATLVVQVSEAKPRKKKLSLAELAALEWKLEQATNALTKNASAKARLKALGELKSVTDHRVVQPLARALKEDPDPKVRLEAATALAAVRTPEAKGVLVLASTGDPDGKVRDAAKAALAKFSRRMKPAALKIKSAGFRKPSRVDGNGIKKALKSPSGDARLWAISQSGTVSFRGREGLVKKHLWSDPSSRVRVKAAQLLARIAKKRALRALIKAAADGDPGVRFEIVRVMSTFDDPGALIAIQKMAADDANATVRAEAKDLLEPSTRVGQRLLKRRIKMLASANPGSRIKALDELAKLTHWRAMVPMSCTLLSDRSVHVRTAAAKTLTNMHDTSVLTALRSAAVIEPDNGLKKKVRKMLGGMRRRVDQLIKQLQSKDANQRLLAARAIGQAAYPPGLKPLIKASKDKQAKVRRAAVRGLRNFDTAKVAGPLKVAMADPDARVRQIVDRYFKQQGRLKGWRKFFRDTNRLVTKTMDKNPTWRADAAIALGIAGAERAVGSLLRLLREDKDEQVRLSAAWGLVLMASTAGEKALKKAAAKDKSQRVRLAARKYLIIGKVSVSDLLAQLRDESADVRRDAAEALSLRANSKVLHHLIRAATCDPAADVRRTALRGLARIGNPLARNVIRTSQARDPDRWVKRVAMMMYILAGGK